MNDLHDLYCNGILSFKASVSAKRRKEIHNIVRKRTIQKLQICRSKNITLVSDYWNFLELDTLQSKSYIVFNNVWLGK